MCPPYLHIDFPIPKLPHPHRHRHPMILHPAIKNQLPEAPSLHPPHNQLNKLKHLLALFYHLVTTKFNLHLHALAWGEADLFVWVGGVHCDVIAEQGAHVDYADVVWVGVGDGEDGGGGGLGLRAWWDVDKGGVD